MPERHTEIGVGARVYPWNATKLIVSITIVLAVIGIAAYVLRWQNAALNVAGPERIERLSREANNHWQSLQAQKATISNQQARLAEFEMLYGVDRAVWPQGKREEYQQLSAAIRNLETAYNLSCGQYNALWLDEWRAISAPGDLPTRCELI